VLGAQDAVHDGERVGGGGAGHHQGGRRRVARQRREERQPALPELGPAPDSSLSSRCLYSTRWSFTLTDDIPEPILM
jgi:hypothetical protein